MGARGYDEAETLMGIFPVDDEGLKYWLALARLRGIDRLGVRGLLQRFSTPREIFESPDAIESFSSVLARGVREFDGWGWVEDQLGAIEKAGARALTFNDPGFPPLLRHIQDPPVMLFARGRAFDEKAPPAAIVGTRHPSQYGLKMAESLGRDLASMGLCVVSGMARGCDMAAHKGALSAGGFTTAVLGTGVDLAYPPESKRLYEEISEKGLLLSEFPMATPPAKHNFPARNRIIAGISLGVVVIEAPLRSGSLMTARLALEYGREVMAVPGQAMSDKCAGTNRLIKDGACLVDCAEDVGSALSLGCVAPKADRCVQVSLADDERLIWSALDLEPVHIDRLIEETGLGAMRASALLLEMEFKGLVRQFPGKCFAKGA